MKALRFFAVFAVVFTIYAVSADAQRRTTTRRTTPKVVTTTNVPQQSPTIKTGSEKVSIQIKNVTKFLYLLGGVARGIEDLDRDQRANQAARQANEQNKRELLQTIRNLRAGLVALEIEFRTNDGLKRHLLQIEGISGLAGQTEDLAVAGRFSESGKPLLLVVEKLSDTLAAM